jgi:hypothetical protein
MRIRDQDEFAAAPHLWSVNAPEDTSSDRASPAPNWHDAPVVQRSATLKSPRDYLESGEWPGGRLTPDAPVAATYLQHISATLARSLEGESMSGVARRSGIARSTLQRLVGGQSWGDVVTLARLEATLDVSLWPTRPPRDRRRRSG